jgi:hypothetical protein
MYIIFAFEDELPLHAVMVQVGGLSCTFEPGDIRTLLHSRETL